MEHVLTFTGPEMAELLPFEPDPSPLGPREVAGPTLVTLVSAGTELHGAYLGASFPARPGYAAVFRVEEVGVEVARFRPGDLAYCSGPHRSRQRVPQERALPVPDGLPPEEAVFARMMGVSMTTLQTTAARPPEQVLVTGLGLVGHLAAQIFTACGYDVAAADPSAERREIAARAGLSRVLPAVGEDDPELAGRISLAVECSGHEGAVLDACRVVRKGGEVVLVGAPWRRYTEATAQDLTRLVFYRYVTLRSGWEWELPLDAGDFRPASIWGNYAAALDWLAAGRVRVGDLYARFSPVEAQKVYQMLLRGRPPRLAVLFDWSLR
jgi:threonine dehydrogenase-like Zn-dependent dehydrogenase